MNQDKLGIQGKRVYKVNSPRFIFFIFKMDKNSIHYNDVMMQMLCLIQSKNHYEIWCKPLADESIAVVLFSRRTDAPIPISFSFKTVSIVLC